MLLPVWNAGSTLAACLRSVQRQTETRWHAVIVDDGSCDDSLVCARWFAERDARFEVVTHPHQGLVTTLNTGLAFCRGQFVARMDADDLMHRRRLAAQMQVLQQYPVLAAVGCHVRLFPRRSLQPGRRAYERWLNGIVSTASVRREAFVECPIAHPTLFMHRQLLVDFGYRDCRWPEDYDLILRLLTSGYDVGMVSQRLLSWRDSPQRLSRRSPRYALERFTACKAAFLAAAFLATTPTYILWGYGSTGRTLRRALLKYGKAPATIVELHPGRLGQRIHDVLVVPPEHLPYVPFRPIVVSVAGATARGQIRQTLVKMGFIESRDFVCAA